MPRHVVRLIVPCCALSLACSDGVGPMPARLASVSPTLSMASLPIAAATVQAIPILDTVSPAAMNDWGEIVGVRYIGPNNSRAFKWEGARGYTELALAGSPSTQASGVNNSGQVVISIDSGGQSVTAIWDWFGNVRRLRNLGTYSVPSENEFPGCTGVGINAQGVVAGMCTVVGLPNPVPTVWTAYGTPDALFPGGGTTAIQGSLQGISDAGYIVGEPFNGAGGLPWEFGPGNTEQLLPAAASGPVTGVALAVNDSGWVAGGVWNGASNCSYHATVWIKGVATDLGVCGYANGITDDGVAIGYAGNAAVDSLYAFVWTAAGGVQVLPGLSTGLQSMTIAINRPHQILGFFFTGSKQFTTLWTLSDSGTVASAAKVARP